MRTRGGPTSLAALVGAMAIAASPSCSSNSSSAGPCDDIPIDELKELMIVDEAVTADARTRNATGGPWSFRYAVENMTAATGDTSTFVRSWLMEWITLKTLNGYTLDRQNEDRSGDMMRRVLCPWQKRTPDNGCNEDCSICTINPPRLDMAKAPFRLLAIANRMDLREQPDGGTAGEARLVFGLTNGSGDDPSALNMPMAIIFEYVLPDSLTPKAWAEAWHDLGRFKAYDDAYKVAMERLTVRWVGRDAAPTRPNGSAIAQVRTNESALNWIWQLRQFELSQDGQLHLAPLRNTPAADLNGSATIAEFITKNAEAIRNEKFLLPTHLRAGSADALIYRWTFPSVEETLSRRFSANTCNGCHAQEQPNLDSAFHISPFRSGVARLSPFIYNPQKRGDDELHKRSISFRNALCQQ